MILKIETETKEFKESLLILLTIIIPVAAVYHNKTSTYYIRVYKHTFDDDRRKQKSKHVILSSSVKIIFTNFYIPFVYMLMTCITKVQLK